MLAAIFEYESGLLPSTPKPGPGPRPAAADRYPNPILPVITGRGAPLRRGRFVDRVSSGLGPE